MFEELARTIIRAARSTVCGALGNFYSLLYQAVFNAYWLMVGWENDTYGLIEWWRGLPYPWPLSAVVDWVLDRLYSMVPYTIGAVTWMFNYPLGWLNSLYDDMFGDWELVAWVYQGFCELESWAVGIGRGLDNVIKDIWKWIVENIADLLDPVGYAICELETLLRFQDPTKPGYQWNYWSFYKILEDSIYDAFIRACKGVGLGILERIQAVAVAALRVLDPIIDPIGTALGSTYRFLTFTDIDFWGIYKTQYDSYAEALAQMLRALPGYLEWFVRYVTVEGLRELERKFMEVYNWVQVLKNELTDFIEDPIGWLFTKLAEFVVDRAEDFLDLAGNIIDAVWEPERREG